MKIDEKALLAAEKAYRDNYEGRAMVHAIEAYEAAKAEEHSVQVQLDSKLNVSVTPAPNREMRSDSPPVWVSGQTDDSAELELVTCDCRLLKTKCHRAETPGEKCCKIFKRKLERESVARYDQHLSGCPLYTEEESNGMRKAYECAKEHNGYTETLYAVATYILRARGHLPLVSHLNNIEGKSSDD